MKAKYDTIKVPATPDYILSVIQDEYRLICENDWESEPDMNLTFDSTIKDWRIACDLLPWKQLGSALNEWFNVSIDSSKWKSLLEPASKKTLKGVCEEIAKYSDRETIKPIRIFGKECLKGGIFLTIRSKLAEAGADVSSLTPKSLLDEYIADYYETFFKISSRLFPNKFPVIKVIKPLHNFSTKGLLLGLAILFLGIFLWPLQICGVVIFVVFFLLAGIAAMKRPQSVKFGELKTFKDMVNCIVDGDTQ